MKNKKIRNRTLMIVGTLLLLSIGMLLVIKNDLNNTYNATPISKQAELVVGRVINYQPKTRTYDYMPIKYVIENGNTVTLKLDTQAKWVANLEDELIAREKNSTHMLLMSIFSVMCLVNVIISVLFYPMLVTTMKNEGVALATILMCLVAYCFLLFDGLGLVTYTIGNPHLETALSYINEDDDLLTQMISYKCGSRTLEGKTYRTEYTLNTTDIIKAMEKADIKEIEYVKIGSDLYEVANNLTDFPNTTLTLKNN